MLRTPRRRTSTPTSPYRTPAARAAEPRRRWSGAGQELLLAVLLLVPAVVGAARARFGGVEAVCLILSMAVLRATWTWLRAR